MVFKAHTLLHSPSLHIELVFMRDVFIAQKIDLQSSWGSVEVIKMLLHRQETVCVMWTRGAGKNYIPSIVLGK